MMVLKSLYLAFREATKKMVYAYLRLGNYYTYLLIRTSSAFINWKDV